MALLLLFVIFGNLILSISASSLTNATQFEFLANDTSVWNITQLICPPNLDCNFTCNGPGTCAYLILNATLANNLYIHCRGESTCFGMEFYANANMNVSIICDNTMSVHQIYGACERIDLYANYAQFVDIQCVGSTDCHTADYYLNYAQNVNILNHGYRSAYYANYFLHNVSNQVPMFTNPCSILSNPKNSSKKHVYSQNVTLYSWI